VLAVCAIIGIAATEAPTSIWAKAGVSLPVGCEESSDVQRIPSPDGEASADVRCAGLSRERNGVVLRITRRAHPSSEVRLVTEPGSAWRAQELLWAPDSNAFVVNGSESAYAGSDFVVYRFDGDRIVSGRITAAAQSDMVRTFPPCRARGLDKTDCQRIARTPAFNMSAIAWTRGSNGLVVFAEVPCSSSHGGIMCQVMGYELEARTGRILARLPARELKRRYQSQMAWPMRIPAKPSYSRAPATEPERPPDNTRMEPTARN
jgi:hypothetical protein